MPLPIAHGLVGASIVAAVHPPTKRFFLTLLLGALLANAADLDFFLVFAFESKAWHRGFSHSITFALLAGLVFLVSLGKRRRTAIVFGLAFASHGILDYVTTKNGAGVELLWPFSSERFGLGWVGLSEWPSRLPALKLVQALILEFALFMPLLILIIGLRKYVLVNSKCKRTIH